MDALGINVFSIVVYSLLFLIIYILLEKALFPGLRKNIEARKALLNKNLEKEKELSKLEIEVKEQNEKREKEVMKEAKNDASRIIENANSEAAEIVKNAKKKAKNLLEDAKSSLSEKEKTMQANFEQQVQDAAEKAISLYYSDKKADLDSALLNKLIKNLK